MKDRIMLQLHFDLLKEKLKEYDNKVFIYHKQNNGYVVVDKLKIKHDTTLKALRFSRWQQNFLSNVEAYFRDYFSHNTQAQNEYEVKTQVTE